MRSKLAAALCLCLAACSKPPQDTAVLTPSQSEIVRNLFDLDRWSKEPKTGIWPGYSPTAMPVMLEFYDRTILINHPHPPQGFRALRVWGGTVFISPKSRDRIKTAFSFQKVNDTLTAVYRCGKADSIGVRLAGLIAHENFHRFQKENFSISPAYFPTGFAPETVADLNIERILLREALYSDNWKSYAERFVKFRTHRYAREKGEAIGTEERWESSEGTAAYVEAGSAVRLFNRGRAPFERLRDYLMVFSFSPERHYSASFYFSGAAQGLILDRLKVPWKSRAQSGESLFDILSERFPFDDNALEADTERLYRQYRRSEFLKVARAKAASKERALKREMSALDEGLRLFIGLNTSKPSASSFTANLTRAIGRSALFVSVSALDLKTEGPITLSLNHLPVILRYDFTSHPGSLESIETRLGKPGAFEIVADRRPLRVAPTASRFSSISVAAPGLEFRSDVPGTIRLDGKTVRIDLSRVREKGS